MRLRRTSLAVALLLVFSVAASTTGASGAPGRDRLEMYVATVDAATFESLVQGGFDIASVENTAEGVRVELVLTNAERNQLRKLGVDLKLWRNDDGVTATELAQQQETAGFKVWRPYDGPNGFRAYMTDIAAANPDLLKLELLGETWGTRDIVALKLTKDATTVPDGTRPAVLYTSLQHAREWISGEVNRRLLQWYIKRYREDEPGIVDLLETTELWFVLVVNPDGYQYTFDVERLWRKNLRDNDGNGIIDSNDGVDPNRNYPEHWNYDEEGSSSQFSSETYRGPAAGSEPETQAIMSLYDQVDFAFHVNYHSFGELLLYSFGWQVQTPAADDPIFVALSGTDKKPAIQDFNPGVGADLYITNGETTDWAHGTQGTLAWTPELSEGPNGDGFIFPDSEGAVQGEFVKNRPFALDVAMSAADPDDPVSHLGNTTEPFYLDVSAIDPQKSHNPLSDLTFDVSYAGGSAQPVEVLAKRDIDGDGTEDPVTLRWSVDGETPQADGTIEWNGGERFGDVGDVYYRVVRGDVTGLEVGDSVEYWFTGGGASSEHATFEVVDDADADVLILAAEDLTGASTAPAYPALPATGPKFVSYYESAVTASGRTSDVYDVDAMGRQAPDHLGVLSHYDAVIWYTGNDVVTREPGWSPGNASRLANDLMLEARAYLNEGGKLLYTGQRAGATENGAHGGQFYDPFENQRCVGGPTSVFARCAFIADKNDFLQYYLGAFLMNFGAGVDPATGDLFPVDGVDDPYTGMSWEFNGTDSAQNQAVASSFLTTSSILSEADYPQFASDAPAVWDSGAGGGAFEPFDGTKYMYSQRADITFKRLMRTIDLTGVGAPDNPTLTFRVSYDTEFEWDFVFVEAHRVGLDDWTTLPDANLHTGGDTGESCPAGWIELHPWIVQHYQGEDCSGTGSTGTWNAASGRSAGWEEWEIDLSNYAGEQVELSISYASDWSVQGLGAFVDQIVVSTGEGSTSFEDDADPMDGWTVAGPAEGSDPNPNDWIRTESVGFEEGAVVSTADTLYFGFGFEGITDADSRAAVMQATLDHLLS